MDNIILFIDNIESMDSKNIKKAFKFSYPHINLDDNITNDPKSLIFFLLDTIFKFNNIPSNQNKIDCIYNTILKKTLILAYLNKNFDFEKKEDEKYNTLNLLFNYAKINKKGKLFWLSKATQILSKIPRKKSQNTFNKEKLLQAYVNALVKFL